MRELLPHQRTADQWAATRDRFAVFLKMRLGKTLIAIKRAQRDDGPKLVVCPLSTMFAWERELGLEGIECVKLIGSTSKKHWTLTENYGRANWFLINPEGLLRLPSVLNSWWRWIILDESTFIKNPRARITKLLLKETKAKKRMILTGTPAPEGPEDFVTQMLWLHGEFMGCESFWEWRPKNMVPCEYKWEVPLLKRKAVAEAVAENSFVMTPEEAGLYMPRVYETRTVQLPANLRRLYRQVCREYRIGKTETNWPLVAQVWLAQLTAGVVPDSFSQSRLLFSPYKIKEVQYLLDTELKGETVLVFGRFIRELDLLANTLKAPCLTGRTPYHHRTEILKNFMQGRTRVLVAQQSKVTEKGLDLSAASVIIFTSNVWSRETREQCEARGDHPAKKEPTLLIDLVAERTIDEAVVEALNQKGKRAHTLMREIMEISRERNLT